MDDEPDVGLLIRQRFRRRSGELEFVLARKGAQALETLKANPDIDVVVTDINMPAMDGLTLLAPARMRALREGSDPFRITAT